MAKPKKAEQQPQGEASDEQNVNFEPSTDFTIDLAELGEGDDGKGGKKAADSDKGGDQGSQDQGADPGDDDEDEGSESGQDASGEQDDDQERVRERRRQERAERKARRESEREELRVLRERMANLEGRQGRYDQAQVLSKLETLDRTMLTAREQYNQALDAKKRAVAAQNGEALVAADEAALAARDAYVQAEQDRARLVQAVNGERERVATQQQQPRLHPVIKEQGEKFCSDFSWFNKDGSDRDSAKVLALDNQLAQEGWNPNTKGFWDELRERVKEELPHRFGGERNNGSGNGSGNGGQRRQITAGSGRESGGRPGGNTYTLSAARVQALKEANMWDDVAQRNKMILRYKKQDEEQARRQRGA